MRCAPRIGVDWVGLGGVWRRCAVGIGGWHVVFRVMSCRVASSHVFGKSR